MADPQPQRPNAPGAINLERYREIERLRSEGATFEEIGTALGITRGRAHQAHKKALRLKASGNL